MNFFALGLLPDFCPSLAIGAFSSRMAAGDDEMPDWKNHGLRIIRSGELDSNTPQTPGMTRAEAISHA